MHIIRSCNRALFTLMISLSITACGGGSSSSQNSSAGNNDSVPNSSATASSEPASTPASSSQAASSEAIASSSDANSEPSASSESASSNAPVDSSSSDASSEPSASSEAASSDQAESSSAVSSSSSSGDDTLETVLITPLGNGSVHFSITLPEQKQQVILFARRNGLQDYVIDELQDHPDAEIDNLDGTYTYQITRTEAYEIGDLIEARFYTYSPASDQGFYPGPDEITWETITYDDSDVPPASSSADSSSSDANSSSGTGADPLETVLITSLENGTVKFSITLPEQKDNVHLFARRNGAQDHVVTDLQGVPGGMIDNQDGTYTYQNIRTEAYTDGDLIEARFYTFAVPPAGSGQIFYPGPAELVWAESIYDSTGAPPASSSAASSSSADSSVPSSSSSAASSSGSGADPLGTVVITALSGGDASFRITVSEQKNTIHLFARRNGLQDYEAMDIQGTGIDNLDGTYTYQVTRTAAYSPGDQIEARFYTFAAPPVGSGEVFYPGPGGANWTSITYGGSGVPASSAGAASSTGHSASSFSNSSYASIPRAGVPVPGDTIFTLFSEHTQLEPLIQFETEDALITRISDRGRDRHAKEDQFQAYDHYLSFYWEHRTASIEIIDYVAKGGSEIRMNVRTEWPLSSTEAENRWFYIGRNTVAEFCDNGTMDMVDSLNYYKIRSHNCREGRAIQIGDKMEFELSQFLANNVPNGRAAYYGTTYLYIVGEGIVPWDVGGLTPVGGIKDSVKIPEAAWLGGHTTLHAETSGEPDNHFMQMATNLGYDNAQPFVLGRRLHHTSFVSGIHDERPVENPVFTEMVGKAGPRYINDSCADCHVRNGRAAPAPLNQPLEKWVFKVGDANGNPHPYLGRVLQPQTVGGAESEGQVVIASWTEENGLRSPNYAFSGVTPERFSARITPQLVGMGLLEAIPEADILALEDPDDLSGNGISGRANRVVDPETGELHLGRFGWKAGTASIRHQVASAFNTDMGVMTSLVPTPDCGSAQTDCASGNAPLSDEHLDNLVKYISLLGVRPQRDHDEPAVLRGQSLFSDIGCADCHTPSFQTSPYHPLAELRDQTIWPYTDLLLHDMGPGLADDLGEGEASGSEWRTAPLWGLGLSACVTGGTNSPGGQGNDYCTPVHSYLHDGRARTIDEAILWHGGEGQASNDHYQALPQADRDDLIRFLESL